MARQNVDQTIDNIKSTSDLGGHWTDAATHANVVQPIVKGHATMDQGTSADRVSATQNIGIVDETIAEPSADVVPTEKFWFG